MLGLTRVIRGLVMATVAVGVVACGSDSVSSFGRGTGGSTDDGGPMDSGTGGGPAGGRIGRGGAPGSTGGRRATGGGIGSGGRSGSGGGGGAPVADAGVTCTNSLDCGTTGVCDRTIGQCVECVSTADCGPNQDCTGRRCVTFLPCANSLDCPSNSVCDSTLRRCVQCAQDLDCDTGKKCIASTCRSACQSDRDCTPLGLLCDFTLGACVACMIDGDCAPSGYCNQGLCAPDLCTAGSRQCISNSIVTCSANGSAFGAPVACNARETCVAAGVGATCQPWACTPDATECQNASRVVCSADGLTVLASMDCSLSGLFCVGGACVAQRCAPNSYFCNGNQVDLCSADGMSSSLSLACPAGTYCNPTTTSCATGICSPGQPACNNTVATTCNTNGSGYVSGGTDCAATSRVCSAGVCRALVCQPNARRCQGNNVLACSADGLAETVTACASTEYCDAGICTPRVCTPNQPACDGNVATICNASGSGFTGARTDCSLTALTCSAGTCTTCPGGNGAVGSVRLQEVHIGTPDYVALRNTSTQCPANLAGLNLVMLDSNTTFFSLNHVFASQTIAPGETVYLFENTTGTGATDINVGGNIGFAGSRGGWIVLCTGSCTTTSAATAVDAIAFASATAGTNQQPPALPAPVTFSPPVIGVSSTTQDATSIVRAQVTGVMPNFTAADWTLAPRTR